MDVNFKKTMTSYMCTQCASVPWIEKSILFGSFAEGTASELSDFDFAFWVKPGTTDTEWAIFCEYLRENKPLLNQLDLIRMDELGQKSQAFILNIQQGEIIYDRDQQTAKKI